jgi:hypothetical protein
VEEPARADAVQRVLVHLGAAAWQATPAVGAGEEFRSDTAGGEHASALVFNGLVVHGSLIMAG